MKGGAYYLDSFVEYGSYLYMSTFGSFVQRSLSISICQYRVCTNRHQQSYLLCVWLRVSAGGCGRAGGCGVV